MSDVLVLRWARQLASRRRTGAGEDARGLVATTVFPLTSMDRSPQAWLTITSPSPPPSQATRGGGA